MLETRIFAILAILTVSASPTTTMVVTTNTFNAIFDTTTSDEFLTSLNTWLTEEISNPDIGTEQTQLIFTGQQLSSQAVKYHYVDYGYDFIASKAESFTFTLKNSYKISKFQLLIDSVSSGYCSSSLRFKQGGSTLFTLYKSLTIAGWYTWELPYEISGEIEIILTPLTHGRTINVALTSASNYQPGNMIEEISVYKKWYVDRYETIPVPGSGIPIFKQVEVDSTNIITESETEVLGENYDYLSASDNGENYLKNSKNPNNSTIAELDADFNSKLLVAPGTTVTIGIWASTNLVINYVPIIQTFNNYQDGAIYRAEEDDINTYSIYRDYWEGMIQTEKLAEIEYPSLITYDLASGSAGYFYPTDLRSFLVNLYYDKHPEQQILDVTAEEIVEGLQLSGKEWTQGGEDQLTSIIPSLDILLSRLQIPEGNLYAKYEQYQGHNLIVLWCEVLSGNSNAYHKPYAYLTDGWEIGLDHTGELFILRESDYISSRVDSTITIENQMMVGKLTERYFWDWLTAEWLLANPDNQSDNNLLVNGDFNVAGSGWNGIPGWQDEYNSKGGLCETVNGVLTFINNEYTQTNNDYSYIRQIIPVNWAVNDEVNLKGKLRLDRNGFTTNIGMAYFYLRFVDSSDTTLGEIMFYQRNDGYIYPNTDIRTSFKAPTNYDDWFTFDYDLTSHYPVNLQDNWQEVTNVKATCILYTSRDESYKAEFDDFSLTVDRITTANTIFGLENEETMHSLNPITNLEAHIGVDPDDPINPYLLQVTAKDNNSMPVQGTGMQLEIRNNEGLLLETLELPANGSLRWHTDTFYPEISVKLKGNSFYDDSSELTVISDYSPSILLKTMGVSITEDASEEEIKRNIELLLIQRYVTESGAFTKIPSESDENIVYAMNVDEMEEWGRNAGAQRMGLEIMDPIIITKDELSGSILTNDTLITVTKYWRSSTWPHPERSTTIELTKIAVLEVWLNIKLYRFYEGSHQLDTNDRSQLDDSINGLYQLLQSDPIEFQSLTEWQKDDLQEEWSILNTQMLLLMTPGFHSIEEDNLFLISWVIDVVVWTATQFDNIISAIVDIVNSLIDDVLDFLGFLWNEIVGPILGSVLETFCSIITMLIEGILNLFTEIIFPDTSSISTTSNPIIENYSLNSITESVLSLEQQSLELDSSVGGALNTVTGMVGPVTDLLTIIDAKSWLPPELGILEPLFALFSPKEMMELIMDIVFSILLDIVEVQIILPVFAILEENGQLNQLNEFVDNIIDFDEGSLGNFTLQDLEQNQSGTINSIYKQTLGGAVDFIEWLSELLNPILGILEYILGWLGAFTQIVGILLEKLVNIFTLDFINIDHSDIEGMSYMLIGGNFTQEILNILADHFGPDDKTNANDLIWNAIPIKKITMELILDATSVLLGSSLVNIAQDFTIELENKGYYQLAQNFMYIGSNAGCYTFMMMAEFYEDKGKCMFARRTEGGYYNEEGILASNMLTIDVETKLENEIANKIEETADVLRSVAISITLVETFTKFLSDLDNGNDDFIFRLIDILYIGSLSISLVCSANGALDNFKSLHPDIFQNVREGQYTGKDIPEWFTKWIVKDWINRKQFISLMLTGMISVLTLIFKVPTLRSI